MLNLRLPCGISNAELEVVIVMQPTGRNGPQATTDQEEWRRFIEETAGGWQGEPFVRPEQGEFEHREEWA